MEAIKDPDGNLTEWLSGRRFVSIDVPKTSIETTIQTGQFKVRLYYKELRATMECKKCLQKGHTAIHCLNEEICYNCTNPGHKSSACPENIEKTGTSNIDGNTETESEVESVQRDSSAEETTNEGKLGEALTQKKEKEAKSKENGQNEESDGKINETEATDIENQAKKDKRNEQKTNVNEQKTNLDRGRNKYTES
ncbi:Gag protein [Elysia marginata]|uniref:Gag protein n=1 Tax=Elysia marginata TaxID=1093978 RepID=A0AAV4J661_9GAST|nr:Gag protein [Elysia marginata]